MQRFPVLFVGIYILFITFISSSKTQTCPLPDFPHGGKYYSDRNFDGMFRLGDTITYNCEEKYALIGNDASKCSSNGEWTNPTPFCDRKANLETPYVLPDKGTPLPVGNVTDDDLNTCYWLKSGEKITLRTVKQKEVYAVRIYLGKGVADFEIQIGKKVCEKVSGRYGGSSQWVLINCNVSAGITDAVMIQGKGIANFPSPICEIQVYVKEEDGCESPPKKKVAKGHFEVGRSIAKLVCEDGYKSNGRLVCEDNYWKSSGLVCDEILCNPYQNSTRAPGSEWRILELVPKISAGTMSELKCSTGYTLTGGPSKIVCQKNGTWTQTTATCVEDKKPKVNTQTVVYAVVGVVVFLIIVGLLGTTIYFVRKQHQRQVVIVYKSPTEGSVISGSEGEYGSAHYETIQGRLYSEPIQGVAPLPPASSRPTAQMLSDGYIAPIDNKDTLTKKRTPADLAFSPLKQSTIYNF